MKFSYEDLISGDSIPVEGIGHIRSPHLYELKPTQGIGFWTYNLYLNLLAWNKDELLKFMQMSSGKKLNALIHSDALTAFDVITILDSPRQMMQTVLAFFMDEELSWDAGERKFWTASKDTHERVGAIDRNNFENVRDMMLQANYISIGRSTKPPHFANEKARELWERAQKYLQQSAKNSSSDKRMELGNIISKLSCVSAGYTLLNIYELTIFQLYDQFFQYGYLRAMNISDMAFSNHGGKDFDMQAWLKPMTNYEKEKQR